MKRLYEFIKKYDGYIGGIFLLSWLIGALIFSHKTSYDIGYRKGGAVGFEIALDTVNKILDINQRCDSCVTKLQLELKYDTATYYINKKLIK